MKNLTVCLSESFMATVKPNRRNFLRATAIGFAAAVEGAATARPLNIILILADNLGHGDLGCYGSTKHRTPHTDRMAREGMRFTQFYVSSGVCTPSRASIMTGCYPRRVGLDYTEPDRQVLRPSERERLGPKPPTSCAKRARATRLEALHPKRQPGGACLHNPKAMLLLASTGDSTACAVKSPRS